MKHELMGAARTGLALAAAAACIACAWMFFTAQPEWLVAGATPSQHAGVVTFLACMAALLLLRALRPSLWD